VNFVELLGLLVGFVSVYCGLWTFSLSTSNLSKGIVTYIVIICNVVWASYTLRLLLKGIKLCDICHICVCFLLIFIQLTYPASFCVIYWLNIISGYMVRLNTAIKKWWSRKNSRSMKDKHQTVAGIYLCMYACV
jgi:hypothetical protein